MPPSLHIHPIPDDFILLQQMLDDARTKSALYKPSVYWSTTALNAANEIKRHGLGDFRGRSNGVGMSYADSQFCDVRASLNRGLRRPYRYLLENVYPFSATFSGQVALTKMYANNVNLLRRELAEKSDRVRLLADSYAIPYSVGAGCVDWVELGGQRISMHYLELLNAHDHVKRAIDFSDAVSLFEIGGGFGVNLHLLIENYRNLRKFVYLDIPPNLYVGTQYLKSFYPEAVRDYRETRTLDAICFSDGDALEIICIAPWQIEKLEMKIDIFQNSHSFVEMSESIVSNYAIHLERVLNPAQNAVALVSYDGYDAQTMNPDSLPGFFRGIFEKSTFETLFGNRQYSCYHSTRSGDTQVSERSGNADR